MTRTLRALADVAFPALTVALGLQMLRVMFPALVLNKRAPFAAGEFAAILFGTFLLAFAAPLLARWLSPRRALIASTAGVALVRIALQLVRNADARIWIASAGVLLFLWFIPLYLGCARGSTQRPGFGPAFLAGLVFDTTLHGLFGTYDYAWVIDAGTIALTVALSAVQLLLLRRFAASIEPAHGDSISSPAWPLAGFGVALFLHAVILQNIARQSTLLQLSTADAFLLVMASNLAALVVFSILPRLPSSVLKPIAFGATAMLALLLLLPSGAIGLILSHVSVAALLYPAGLIADRAGERAGLSRTAVAWAGGMLAFLLLMFVYYFAYNVALPFENDVLFFVATGLLGIAAYGAASAAREPGTLAAGWMPIALGALLLIFPAAIRLAAPTPIELEAVARFPLRVMSYNIHMGFDVDGWADLESLARTIESGQADIVVLQEVPRGWYINASIDAPAWLSRRLGMSFVFAGSADAVWGNVILSRYRIIESESEPLPEAGVRPRRNLIWAEVQADGPGNLIVIAAHLDHNRARSRLEQIPTLLAAYQAQACCSRIVIGDMNSTPNSTEYVQFRDAGLSDAYLLAGVAPDEGFTFRADAPDIRIDYIWLSPDLSAADFRVLEGAASDHRGLAVTLDR